MTRAVSPDPVIRHPLKIAGLARTARRTGLAILSVLAGLIAGEPANASETWRGLTVAPEFRCSPYSSRAYAYPQSVEPRIVATMGGRIYGPYSGRWFGSIRETDIEHIVARSEAHDSGLCAVSPAVQRQFASDLLNLTLASPALNRHQKRDHDAADWMPPINKCWYSARVIEVRRKYGLTIDRREAASLERVLRGCESVEMIVVARSEASTAGATGTDSTDASEPADALARWDDNRNGRITCKEARRHGIAPVPRGHPAYRFMRDGDGDGVVCE